MKSIELYTRIVGWSSALSLIAVKFWELTRVNRNLAFGAFLVIIWLAILTVMTIDLANKIKSRNLLNN